MSDRLNRILPDFSDETLESIWDKYSASPDAPPPPAEEPAPSAAEQPVPEQEPSPGGTTKKWKKQKRASRSVFKKRAGAERPAEDAAAPDGLPPEQTDPTFEPTNEPTLVRLTKPAEEPTFEPADEPTLVREPQTAESIAERSRRIVMNALGETLRQYRTEGLPEEEPDLPFPVSPAAEATPAEPAEDEAPAEPVIAEEEAPPAVPAEAEEAAPEPAAPEEEAPPAEQAVAEEEPPTEPADTEKTAPPARSSLREKVLAYQRDGAPEDIFDLIFDLHPTDGEAPAGPDNAGDAPARDPEPGEDGFMLWVEEEAPTIPDEDDVRIAEGPTGERRYAAPTNEPTRHYRLASEEPAPPKQRRPRVTVGEDGIITLYYGEDDPAPVISVGDDYGFDDYEAEPEEEDEEDEEEAYEEDEYEEDEEYEDGIDDEEAEVDYEEEEEEEEAPPQPARTGRTGRLARARRAAKRTAAQNRANFSDKVLNPAVRLLAVQLAKRQMQKKEAASWPDPVDVRETPELSPKNAARYYANEAKKLKLRLNVSLFMTVILAWIALGLPMGGMLGRSLALQAGVSLVLTLTVMVAALDVTAAGLRQVCELSPGPEALAVLSALISCVDAALTLFGYGDTLPFCAVGAAAMTAALWGDRLYCRALMRTFRTAAASRDPACVCASPSTDKTPSRLYRVDKTSLEGFVRRSESQDMCRTAYAAAAPILLLAAFILSVAASISSEGKYFLHTLSALISVGTSFAAFFGFSLPFAAAARRLRDTGAAVAGFAGCAELAKTKELIVTDGDLFPPGTMRFSSINILEGMPQHKVVIAAASLLYTSGSGVTSLFRELVERRGYNVPEPREYSIHESGGLSGIVNGEHVDVGPARFMNLQGIRLPQNLVPKNAICVAISGELVGVFSIEYTPFTSVQEAIVTALRGRTVPLFAVRDFNITPKMIHDLFKLPSTNFNFPAYRDRTRIRLDADRPIDAVVARRGMLPFVEAAEAGRRLYNSTRTVTVLSLIGSAVGMVILFLLCRTGAFDTANVGNVLLFMLLWALPAAILSYGRGK